MTGSDDKHEEQRKAEVAEAAGLTQEMRSSEDETWREVRARLAAEGVAPTDAAVGTLFSDDVNVLFGLIEAKDGRSFWFTFEQPRGESWRFFQWGEVAPEMRPGLYERFLATARALLDAGSPEQPPHLGEP